MACELLFWREYHDLQDGSKFTLIERSDQKLNILTIPGYGFRSVLSLIYARNDKIDFGFLFYCPNRVNRILQIVPNFWFSKPWFHPFLRFKSLFWCVNRDQTKFDNTYGYKIEGFSLESSLLYSRDGLREKW